MPEGLGGHKICSICGEDCADRPRVKDAKGRYYCRACAESAAAERTPQPPPPPADDDPLELDLDEPDEPDEIAIEPEAPSPRAAGFCPVCARVLAPDTGLCPSCGYDPAKGLDSSRHVAKKPDARGAAITCRSCGYDMAGLRTLKCPECGAVRPPPSADTPDKQRPVLDALKAPALCVLVSIVGLTVVGLLTAEPFLPLYILASYVITLPIGIAVFYLCCLVWIGFDAPFYLNAANLLATYAVSDLAGAILMPLGCFGWPIQMFIYVGVLSQLLELELMDAVLVAFITGAVKVALAFVILYYMLGVF